MSAVTALMRLRCRGQPQRAAEKSPESPRQRVRIDQEVLNFDLTISRREQGRGPQSPDALVRLTWKRSRRR